MRLVILSALTGSLVLTLVAADEAKPAAAAKAGEAPTLSAAEQAVLEATNKQRKAADLPPLKPHAKLLKMAREQSARMARLNKLGHDLEGKPFADRIKESGYPFAATGENVGEGYKTGKAAVAGWMDSPPHKKNLLGEEFTEIGVAVADAADGTRYWTQVFGKPREE